MERERDTSRALLLFPAAAAATSLHSLNPAGTNTFTVSRESKPFIRKENGFSLCATEWHDGSGNLLCNRPFTDAPWQKGESVMGVAYVLALLVTIAETLEGTTLIYAYKYLSSRCLRAECVHEQCT